VAVDKCDRIDVTVDGADEIGPGLGGGGKLNMSRAFLDQVGAANASVVWIEQGAIGSVQTVSENPGQLVSMGNPKDEGLLRIEDFCHSRSSGLLLSPVRLLLSTYSILSL